MLALTSPPALVGHHEAVFAASRFLVDLSGALNAKLI